MSAGDAAAVSGDTVQLVAEYVHPSPPGHGSNVAAPTLANEFTDWKVTDDYRSRSGWFAYNWAGVYGNMFKPSNVTTSVGRLNLRTVADGSLNGGEISSVDNLGYGYYETKMKAADVSGVCSSFFWYKDAASEVDVEFLTNESWLDSRSSGVVHLTWHGPSGQQLHTVRLGFNPSKSYHRYGFLIRPRSIIWYVDGHQVLALRHLPANLGRDSAPTGGVKASNWTGNPEWGGGPPATDAVASYEYMRYWKGARTAMASP